MLSSAQGEKEILYTQCKFVAFPQELAGELISFKIIPVFTEEPQL